MRVINRKSCVVVFEVIGAIGIIGKASCAKLDLLDLEEGLGVREPNEVI